MPPRTEGGTTRRPKPPRVPSAQKQATIWAAEQSLKPWEIPKPPRPSKRPGAKTKVVSQDERYQAAVAAPVSRQARKRLAETMTPERRAQHAASYRPPPPPRHRGGFLGAVRETPGSVLGHLAGYGRDAEHVAGALGTAAGKAILEPAIEAAYGPTPRGAPVNVPRPVAAGAAGARLGAEKLGEWTVGPQITGMLGRAGMGEPVLPRGKSAKGELAAEAVLLPTLVGGKPFRAGRAAMEAAAAARGLSGPARQAAVERAFEAALEGPSLAGAALTKAKQAASRATTIRVPERELVHGLVDRLADTPKDAAAIKTMYDAHVVISTKGLPVKQRRQAAAEAYDAMAADLRQVKLKHADVIQNDLAEVEPGSRVTLDMEDNLVGHHRIDGELKEVGPTRVVIVDDQGREHKIPYGRVVHARPEGAPSPHRVELPDYEQARENIGAPARVAGGSHAIADEILASGVRLPAHLRDPGELAAAVERVTQLAREGYAHRDWYVRASAEAEKIYQAYKDTGVTRPQVVQLMAIFSTQVDPTVNTKFVIEALDQHAAGLPIKTGKYGSQSKNAESVFKGEGWSGRKRNSFYANMLKGLDPEAYAALQAERAARGETVNPVTADMWVVRMFAPWQKSDVPGKDYDAFEKLLTAIGEQQGMSPEEVQAAAWVAAKSRGILGGDVRRGSVRGQIWRTSPERATERGADAYETGVSQYLRRGEPEVDGGARPGRDLRGQGSGGEGAPGERPQDGGGVGSPVPAFTERDPAKKRDRDAFIQAVRRNPDPWSVSEPSHDELKNARFFLSEDGEAGYGIRQDGELFSVFRNAGPKGVAYEAALQGAHRGASWLNIWDIPKVMGRYEDAGWVEVARMRYVAEHAPEGMPEEMQGRDVVFMAFGARPHPVREFEDWDTAVGFTREVANPATPGGALERPGFRVSPSNRQALDYFRENRLTPLLNYEPPPGPLALRAGTFLEQAKQIRPGSFLARSVAPGERNEPLVEQAAASEPFLSTEDLFAGAGTPQERIRARLGELPDKHAEQEALRSPERARRFSAEDEEIDRLLALGHSPTEAIRGAKRMLRGKYPALNYKGFQEFNDEAQQQLVRDVLDYYRGQGKPRTGARLGEVIADAREHGRLPTPSEHRDLVEAFGQDVADSIANAGARDDKHWLLNVLGIPRALQTTLDVSYLLRQGLVAGARHPLMAGRNFRMSLRYYGSTANYDRAMQEIVDRPNSRNGLYDAAKIAFTDIDHLTGREEAFVSTYAETITGGKYSPIKASNRAYTGFLNKMRADMFDNLVEKAQQAGALDLTDEAAAEAFLRDLGRYVNAATGRGDLGKILQPHALSLNTLLFSPRLLKSRLDLMFTPANIALMRRNPWIWRQQMSSVGATIGFVGALLWAAKMAGADVNLTNPTSADFGKMKWGDHRVDLWGGFQPWVRFIASLATNTTTSTRSGQKSSLGIPGIPWTLPGAVTPDPSDPTKPTAAAFDWRFLRSKLGPVPGLLADWQSGEDFAGNPFQWKAQIYQRLAPLGIQDLTQAYNQSGGGLSVLPPRWQWDPEAAKWAAALFGLSVLGGSSNTYPPLPPGSRGGPAWGGGGGGTPPWGGGGGASVPWGS